MRSTSLRPKPKAKPAAALATPAAPVVAEKHPWGFATRFQSGNPGTTKSTPIDLDQIERAAGIGCNRDELGAIFGMSGRHIDRRIAADPALAEAIERGRAMGRATLRRMQWQGAEAGNPAMLVWLGKQLLNQRDRHELTGENGGPVITEVVYRWADPPQIEAVKDE